MSEGFLRPLPTSQFHHGWNFFYLFFPGFIQVLMLNTLFNFIVEKNERWLKNGKKIGKLKIFVVMEEEFASVRKEQEVCYLVGNKTFLGEAFLIMTSVVGVQQQQEVLASLLELLLTQWTQQDWQNAYLSDPYGFVRLCADTPLMWSIFHTGKNEANYGTYI